MRVAAVLGSQVKRAGDLCARYGGEEFVALMPQTPTSQARLMAEKVRSAVEEASIPHEHSPTAPVVTISCGVAAFAPTLDRAPEQLLHMADQALYLAKESGRNRVHQVDPE